MMNQQDLERKIAAEQAFLYDYEEKLSLEDEPRRKRKLEAEIEETKIFILGLQTELAQQRTGAVPERASARRESRLIANAPYGLETELVGREKERLLLDDWFHHDLAHPFLAVIGLGGQGKSALAWDWLQRLMRAGEAPPLVVWWSFYETDGAMDQLMAEVLAYFGDDPRQFTTLRAAVNQFIHHLRRTPALIMLDGAERLLRAYSGLGAAYQGDAEAAGSGDRVAARQCVDPVTGILLGWLAQPGLTQATTLMSSRLFPQELAGRSGQMLAGARRHDLTGLAPEAAFQMFSGLGIDCTRAEVEAVCAPLGYHPLSLALLAGYAAHDPAAPHDLRAAADYDPTADLLGKRQHILARAYHNLPATGQHLLSRLAAFRGSVAWETIEAVFGGGQKVRNDLRLLQQRGLLQHTATPRSPVSNLQSPSPKFDLHPIVRRYAYDRLADPAATHAQLVDYFEAAPKPQQVQSVADLAPTIELYHHLARAGRYDEACDLFYDRLASPLYFQLGAYQQVIELLRVLFPDGEDKLPRLSQESDQAWTLNTLAVSYSLSGQPKAAVPLFQQQIAIREKQGDKKNTAVGLGNLADDHMKIGALAEAAGNLRRRISLCREIEDREKEGTGRYQLGRTLSYCGQWDEAETEFSQAMKIKQDTHHVQAQGIVWAYRALAALLRGEGAAAQTAAQEALRLADETARTRYPVERDYVRAHWLLGWAALALGQRDEAQTRLDEALRRCRAINMVDHEPAILLAQARLARAGGRNAISSNTIAEARRIAERSGYVLDLADIDNHLSHLALDAADPAAARQHAQTARGHAFCDGPPYAYQPALDEAERLLASMS